MLVVIEPNPARMPEIAVYISLWLENPAPATESPSVGAGFGALPEQTS
jgi:hypothetical protein